jgi:hypothetical protein
VERRERRFLERLGDLDARRAHLLRHALENPRAWILRAIHPMAEAHDPTVLLEEALHVTLRIAGLRNLVEHRQHPGRRAAVERPAQRSDGR